MADNKKPTNVNRRNFLKLVAAGAATSAVAIAGCKAQSDEHSSNKPVPTDKMTYRNPFDIKDKVSILGYGCMRLPQKPDPKDPNNEILDQKAINESVDYAMAHGVNYYDTSPRYCQGESETAMGIALSRHPRNKYFVATKLSNFDPESQTREGSIEMYRNSFKQLKTDYIDYYLLHAIGDFDTYKARYVDNGMLDFLIKEREAGRIRHLGWSFHGTKDFFDYMLTLPVKWDFVQIQLNYLDWHHNTREVNADYLYGELAKINIPAVIMEPLLGGGLSTVNYKVQELLKQADSEATIASWAFRFAGSLPGVLTVLSGMTYMEHLQDNLRTFAPLVPLTDKEKDMLEKCAELIAAFPEIGCTGCQYCMPCPYGIDIPGIFAHYNKCLKEGNFPSDVKDPAYDKARRAFLIGYDRSVPRLRQADHCIHCGQCLPKCPQHIEIPTEMEKIDQYVNNMKLQNK